jgi:hypothetical protein
MAARAHVEQAACAHLADEWIMSGRKFHQRAIRQGVPAALRGLGHRILDKQRGLRGTTLGPADKGRRLSRVERAAVEQALRAAGVI